VSDPAAPAVAASARLGRFALRALLVLVTLALVGSALAAFEVRRRLTTPYKGFSDPEVFVELPAGAGVTAIGQSLAAAGVVPDVTTFRIAVWKRGAGRALKAGEYVFREPASPEVVVARLVRGDVHLRTITFPEGLTIREMAGVFASRGFGDARAFVAAASDPSLVRDLDPAASDLEGYLFPDTYALPRRATADDLARMMVARFREVIATLRQQDGPVAAERSLRGVITLASLVEKETALDEERPVVAAVYANRLRIGMPLQCDPTVIYALVRAGVWNGNLTRANLQVDSPYNTYRYRGLPPGPIASPGRASIAAALAPASAAHLYFVSRNDGSHVFAATLAEHNRNVQRFQVQYFRDRRARERAEAAPSGR
jgi:UPF0755 protein